MLSFLWLVGLCWFHPPHVTDSRPSCSRNKVFVASSDELLLVFVDFIPLLYYFPLSPHYWALDFFFSSSSCKKGLKKVLFQARHFFLRLGEM